MEVGSQLKKRAVAVGVAVLAIFGMVQTVGTSAAFADTAVARSSFSSGASHPTPLVQNISCSTRDVWGGARTVADISWGSPPTSQLRPGQSYGYRIKVVQDAGDSNVTADTTTNGTRHTLTPPPETPAGRPVVLPNGGTAELVDVVDRKVLIRRGSEEVCRVSVDDSTSSRSPTTLSG
ncbi:hypothetical protein [Prescottella soli]